MTSFIFDIKRYAIHDGPGIRITLFFKGCPLSCVWCHNPEGISFKQEKLYTAKKCIGCKSCIDACEKQALTLTESGMITDRDACVLCGNCAKVCSTMAMELSGREYTVDILIKEIEKERVFMDQSGGGVTFCGGEPLSHPAMLLSLLRRCGDLGIHRVVDTSMYAPESVVREVMQSTELFLIDLKLMDLAQHKQYCGVKNEQILSNIRMVSEAGKDYIIRIPLIEGVNTDEENITRSAAFLSSLPKPPKEVNLLPYHNIGKGKHEKLGTVYNPKGFPLQAPSQSRIQQCIRIFNQYGINPVES